MHLIGKKMHLTKKLCKCCFFKIENIKFRLSECVLERRMRAYSRAQDYLGFLCVFLMNYVYFELTCVTAVP